MNMTYRELQAAIDKLDDEQKDCNVTVYVEGIDEFYPIKDMTIISETGVLDAGHPVMNTPED